MVGIQLRGLNGSLGEITSFTFHGSDGGGDYWLNVAPEIRLTADKFTSDGAEVRGLKGLLRLGSSPLAQAHIDGSPVDKWFPYTDRLPMFMFRLSSRQLETIEAGRQSANLKLSISIGGECYTAEQLHSFTGQSEVEVLQQDWLRVLKEMKYQDTLIYELIVPTATSEEYRDYVTKARRYFEIADYKASIGVCRDIIDELRKERQSSIDLGSTKKKRSQDRNLEERMLILEDAVRDLSHLGHHVGDDHIDRSTAKSVLGFTIMLLSR